MVEIRLNPLRCCLFVPRRATAGCQLEKYRRGRVVMSTCVFVCGGGENERGIERRARTRERGARLAAASSPRGAATDRAPLLKSARSASHTHHNARLHQRTLTAFDPPPVPPSSAPTKTNRARDRRLLSRTPHRTCCAPSAARAKRPAGAPQRPCSAVGGPPATGHTQRAGGAREGEKSASDPQTTTAPFFARPPSSADRDARVAQPGTMGMSRSMSARLKSIDFYKRLPR
jgi:hypothetical protein